MKALIIPGSLGWNANGAHDEGCSGGLPASHGRCEFPTGQWSASCPDMPMGDFKGKPMVIPPKRLNDKAWTEVKIVCES